MSDKPFRTIDEQMEILNQRGVETDDFSALILRCENYYSIVNGYKDLFIDPQKKMQASGEDRYISGTTFSGIYNLFLFDRELRLLLFKFLTIAESTLKSIVAYVYSEYYKNVPAPYLIEENYRREPYKSKLVHGLCNDFKSIVNIDGEEGTSKKTHYSRPYIDHYIAKHDELPLWVLVNFLSFGDVSRFYSCQKEFMRNNIAREVSKKYNSCHEVRIKVYEEELRLIFDHLKDFRNICAHDERLFCTGVGMAKDIFICTALCDLEKILFLRDFENLIAALIKLTDDYKGKFSTVSIEQVIEKMGFASIDTLSCR